LADLVAGMTGGARVDRAAPVCRLRILRHVRRNPISRVCRTKSHVS
jgi:hypothetical protein